MKDIRLLAAGGVVALAFSQVLGALPPQLLEPGSLALGCVFATLPPVAAATIWTLRRLAADAESVRHAVAGSLLGALSFDGLAVAFVPDLYGQDDPASLASGAAVLLFGIFCFGGATAVICTAGTEAMPSDQRPTVTGVDTR